MVKVNGDTALQTLNSIPLRGGSNFLTTFNRRLASTEQIEREQALGELLEFLIRHQAELSNRDSLMLVWKGIFYNFWMADKPLFQQALADTLAEHLLQLPENLALLHLECFWLTMIKEWPGIDYHRLDKFMLLQRRFVNAGFRLLLKHNFEPRVVSEVGRIFREGPFHPTSIQVYDAIRYHVIDVYLTELKLALPFDGPAYELHLALGPVMTFFTTTTNKVAYKKVQDLILEALMVEMTENPKHEVFQCSAVTLAKEWFKLGAYAESNKVRSFSYKMVGELTQLFSLHDLDLAANLAPAEASHTSFAGPILTKRPLAPQAIAEPAMSSAQAITHGKTSASDKDKPISEFEKALQKSPKQRTRKGCIVSSGFKVIDLSSPEETKFQYKDGEVDPLSRCRVLPLDDSSSIAPCGDECVATHDVYVEDLIPEGAPSKRVRWNLERNHVQTFEKGSSIPCVSSLKLQSNPTRGLLKASSLPIRLNKRLFEISSLGLPACFKDPKHQPPSAHKKAPQLKPKLKV